VATNVVEVGNGRVINYGGSYKQYLAALNREIDAEEEAAGGGRTATPRKPGAAGKSAGPERPGGKSSAGRPEAVGRAGHDARSDRDVRREIGTLERAIAKLDAEKRAANEAMLATTDPAEALRHHTAMTVAAEKLSAAEERWLELQEQVTADG
jgi:ATP-binding cassette subfamily F protein 3